MISSGQDVALCSSACFCQKEFRIFSSVYSYIFNIKMFHEKDQQGGIIHGKKRECRQRSCRLTARAQEISILDRQLDRYSSIHFEILQFTFKGHAVYFFIAENPTTTKLIFQKLPCHLKRRAMSHNLNRMPRALREAHIAQVRIKS